MHTFPATFPLRVGEEAPYYLGIKVALAFEIAIKSTVRKTDTGHNLVERDTLKAMAIK
jgi:hypothetical protein